MHSYEQAFVAEVGATNIEKVYKEFNCLSYPSKIYSQKLKIKTNTTILPTTEYTVQETMDWCAACGEQQEFENGQCTECSLKL